MVPGARSLRALSRSMGCVGEIEFVSYLCGVRNCLDCYGVKYLYYMG
jgi:hypothetical protein